MGLIDATDRQIDGLVYELYGLTAAEIRAVEGRGSRQASVGGMRFQPLGYFSQNLAQIGLIRGSQTILWADMFVMGESNDLRVVGGVVISKNALAAVEICVCVTDTHRIAQLRADHFVNVEE